MGAMVLLVDDDPSRIERLSRIVERTGATPVLAGDPCDAMRIFVCEGPDLTLIQDDVGKERGFELCKDMKRLRAGSRRAVVVMASGKSGYRRAAREAHCNACVRKPFGDRTLLRVARRLLAETLP